jgi:PAS domain S-box-containing protein
MEDKDHRILLFIMLALLIVGLVFLVIIASHLHPIVLQTLNQDFLLFIAFLLIGIPIAFFTWIAVTDFQVERIRMRNHDLVVSTALEHSDIAIMVTNAGMRGPSIKIRYVNPAWERLFGWRAEEVIDRETPHLLNSGRQSDEFYQSMWEALEKNQPFSSHVIDRCKDGHLVEIDSTIVPVCIEGRLSYYVGILRDVTERMREQEHLKKQKQDLERMNRLMVDRELRMKELKTELAKIKAVS